MNNIQRWSALAEKLGKAGYAIFDTAKLQITEKGFADEKIIAVTLLARTMSNLKGTMILISEKRIVEARTIARCCFENQYWSTALIEEGEQFTRKMVDDEMKHRTARGQLIFQNGLDLDPDVSARLRGWLKTTNQRYADAKTLNPKQVASVHAIGKSYIFYSQISSDAAHPSVASLNRYIVPHTPNEIGGIDVEPIVSENEIVDTLNLLCLAVMGVCVGVNQILGGTPGGEVLDGLATEYVDLMTATKSVNPLSPEASQ